LKANLIKKKNTTYIKNLYILILGVFTSLSLPPYHYWIINFFTFSLIFIFLIKNKSQSIKAFFLYGCLFGFGYFISSLYWIPLSLLYDDNFKIFIPFAILLIPLFLSLFYGFAFLIFKLFLKSKIIIVNILIFSSILGLFEFIRGNILSGFPWNLFAYSFSEFLEFIQVTSLIGIYSFNMVLITIFCAPSILYLDRQKKDLLGFYLIIVIVICNYLYGSLEINKFRTLKTEILNSEINVLSTSIPVERFYKNVDDEEILLKLIKLSKTRPNTNAIFIWPEGIIPNINLTSLKNQYGYLFSKFFSQNQIVVLGINNYEIQNEKPLYYNSLSVIDNEANVKYKYYKNKLVPFGEFLPLESVLSKIGLKTLTNNYQSYSEGMERKVFNLDEDNKIKVLPLICYEIIYSGKLHSEEDYNFILNISEDGWFGNSIGPYQHFSHSIFRSVEYGKYTLRSSNNGISAIVDPTGSILSRINIDKEGIISIKEIVNVDNTFFSTYGNKIYFLIILLYIFLIFSFKKTKNE
tara:strand:+ start:6096 stop:7658 length:1563 start_codon:yes stop_codon:yes gene_type:complete